MHEGFKPKPFTTYDFMELDHIGFIYVDLSGRYSCLYSSQLPLHLHMSSHGKILLRAWLLTIMPNQVLFIVHWNKVAPPPMS